MKTKFKFSKKFPHKRAFVTGAGSGFGQQFALDLAGDGWHLGLTDLNASALESTARLVAGAGGSSETFAFDVSEESAYQQAAQSFLRNNGGIDLLINCAGVMSFCPLVDEDPAILERIVQLNLAVPMLLARQVLPAMLERGSGRIVNIGSTFGSIGFAWFAAYSASKFGLRGLSEALRRELDGSGVGLTYVAPRAVRTGFNNDAVYRMADATGMKMDDPAWVASRIVNAIEHDAKDVYLGFPEKFFARLNGLLPRLVDGGLRRQNQVMAPFARGS